MVREDHHECQGAFGTEAELESFMEELTADMPRSKTRGWARSYVDGDRKSVEPMAARLAARLAAIDRDGRDVEQALQQFVNQSPWPASAARDRLGCWVAKRGGSAPGSDEFLIVDDTGFPKQGRRSVGWTWCVGVDSTLVVIDPAADLGSVPEWSGRGRKPTRPVNSANASLRSAVKEWAVGSLSEGRKNAEAEHTCRSGE